MIDKIDKLEQMVKILAANKNVASNKTGPVAASEKKKRNMTMLGADRSARWIFYQEHKNDDDIIAQVRGGLQNGNMLVKKTKIVDGVSIEKEFIPYTLVKMATDLLFDAMSDSDKDAYIIEAFDRHNAK
jgi:hypothetical protein